MPVDVINPDSTDPLALSEDRDVDSRRDATAGIAASTATFEGSTIGLTPPEPEPLPVVVDTDLTNVQSNPNVPRVYPNLPANIVPPTELNLGAFQGDQEMIDNIIRGSGDFALQDDVILNQQLSSVFNSGTPFGPNRPLFQEPDIGIPENPYPQLIGDATEYRAEQAANSVSPIGIDPNTGEIVPGTRNALSGNPLSRLFQEFQQFAVGDTGTAFEESLPTGEPIRNLGRRFRDVFRGYSSAFQTNQGQRFLQAFESQGTRRLRNIQTPADRFAGNLDVLSERVIQPLAAFTGADFQPTEEFEQPEPGFLDTLTEESLLTRDLFTGLAAGQQSELDNFAPLQGRFNDFGNAGVLSGLLYLANIPEGLASGVLYELTNFGIDNLTDRELPPDRVRLFDALRGRDLGFMNRADEARYLSFVDGDNNQGLLNRIGISNRVAQNTAGFVTDVIWGGITDFGSSNILSRISRRTIDPAVARALPLQTLDGTNVQRAIRNIITDNATPPAQSVASINRLVDDALSAQAINRTLPLRVTPEVESLVRGTSRSLVLDADGIPLRVKVGDIRRAISGDVTLTPRVEVIDNLNIARLAEVEQSILDTQSAVTENLVRINEARTNLANVPEDASVLDEFTNVQLELIRTNQSNNIALNNRIQSFLTERRSLSQRTGQLNELALKEINESVARQQTNLNGNVLETIAPDSNLDATIPIINQLSIQESVPLVDIMQIYRADPVNVVPSQLALVRRTDEQLTELAKFHNLITPDSPVLSAQQVRTLQSNHPNLLARFGNPIDDNISSPLKRLEINPPDPLTNEPQRSIIVDVSPTTVGVRELPPIPRLTVNNLSKRRERLVNRLAIVRDFKEEDRILNQIDKIDRRTSEIISQSNPDSVNDFYIGTLPRRLTPLTPNTRQVARSLANAEAVYKESTESARRVHQQLIDAQDVIQEQERILQELPPLERQTLQHEVATKNNFVPNGDGVPTVASSQQEVIDQISELQGELRNRLRQTDEAAQEPGIFTELPSTPPKASNRPTPEQIDQLVEGDTVATGRRGVMFWAEVTSKEGDNLQVLPTPNEPNEAELVSLVRQGSFNYDLTRANELFSFIDTPQLRSQLEFGEGALSFDEFEKFRSVFDKPIELSGPKVFGIRSDASFLTSAADIPIPKGNNAPTSLSRHLQSNGIWYHGTKSRINDFSVIDYSLGSSVTNELGPGLYLTTDRGLGEVFAKAQPVVDRTPNPSLRSQNIGELSQLSVLPDNASNFIDASKVVDADSPIRGLFIGLVRDNLSSSLSPVLKARLIANVRNSTRAPYQEWFHRLRVQWMRLRPDSQSDLIRFNKEFTNALADSGTPGAFYKQSNGHFTLALYNDSAATPLPIAEIKRTSIGTGQPEEQVLNRYAADLFADNEINDRTTKLNLESSRLNVDNTIVRNLKDATKEAYQQSLDDTQRMLSLQNNLDEVVTRETKQQLSDINENAPRDAANRLRRFRGDNNAPCI